MMREGSIESPLIVRPPSDFFFLYRALVHTLAEIPGALEPCSDCEDTVTKCDM
jgi:hypothetical protein